MRYHGRLLLVMSLILIAKPSFSLVAKATDEAVEQIQNPTPPAQSPTPPVKPHTKQAWQLQVDDLDEEIRKLTNQRNLYLSKATRLQNQGDRLQFESHDLLDARRAWQQAEINREIATRLQEEIDILEKQRKDVLFKNGIKNYPPSSAYQRNS